MRHHILSKCIQSILFAALTAVAFTLASPALAQAYDDYAGLSVSYGWGDFTIPPNVADVTGMTYGLEYTRFFNSLESDASPYGAREFLQHPNSFSIVYSHQAMNMQIDALRVDTDLIMRGFTVGGMYYTDSQDTPTGLGLDYSSTGNDYSSSSFSIPLDDTHTINTSFMLTLHQYVQNNTRIEFQYENANSEERRLPASVSERSAITSYSLGASALIDDIFLSAGYRTGKTDYDGATADKDMDGYYLATGYYIKQDMGVILSYFSETSDSSTGEVKNTMLAIIGDLYMGDDVNLNLSLTRMERENTDKPSGDTETLSVIVPNVTLGFYF